MTVPTENLAPFVQAGTLRGPFSVKRVGGEGTSGWWVVTGVEGLAGSYAQDEGAAKAAAENLNQQWEQLQMHHGGVVGDIAPAAGAVVAGEALSLDEGGFVRQSPIWTYEDRLGITRTGQVEKIFDHGGSDITYMMRRADGTVDMLSGSRLKAATVEHSPPSLDDGGVVAVVHEGEVVTPLDELSEVAESAAAGEIAIVEAEADAAVEIIEAQAEAEVAIIEAEAEAAATVAEAEAAADATRTEALADAAAEAVEVAEEAGEAAAESGEPEVVAAVASEIVEEASEVQADTPPEENHWFYRKWKRHAG